MSTVDFTGAVWRKSGRSTAATNANCVQVAFAGAAVGVRDSKNTATALAFPAARWALFVRSLGV